MARFRFSLERLLAVRRTAEDAARAAVADATAAVMRESARLEDAYREVHLAQMALRSPVQPIVCAAELACAAQYVTRAGRGRAEAQATLAAAREVQSQKAAAARAAWQAREMLDNLRAQRFAAHRRDEEKAAQAAVDDLTASRWERRSHW